MKKAGDMRQNFKMNSWMSAWVFVFMVTIYIMVLATTLSIHQKHKRYLRDHPYFSEVVQAQKKEFSSDNKDIQPQIQSLRVDNNTEQNEEGKDLPPKDIKVDLTVGQLVTEILENKATFDRQQRLEFTPGTLSLTQARTFSYCYADPKIYGHHFSKRKRRSIPISSKLKLVFVMIAKSGSSTGRWIMNSVLGAEETRVDKDLQILSRGKYEDFSVISFVRDPLSRFYSSYDEVFYRYGPWMKEPERNGRYDAWAKHVRQFEHPHAFIYENMTTYQDFQDAFCPPSFVPEDERSARPALPRRPNWCAYQPTRENGTLAAAFERFVFEYDGISPWDVHLHLQVPMLSNHETGLPVRVTEIFNTETATKSWEDIVSRYGETLPESENLNGRATPRRFNPTFVSIEAKRKICQIAAIDYCCLNLKLPTECSDDVSCALDVDEQGAYRIQPWKHPNEVADK